MSGPFDKDAAVAEIAAWGAQFVKMMRTEASRADGCRPLIDAIHAGTLSLEDAVAAAINGDPYLDRATRHVAREHLATGYIPPALGPFIDYVLRSEGPAKFPKGQHSYNSRNRNIVVKVLVEQTRMRWGVDVERSDATPRDKPCASSLVAEALQILEVEISERRIVEVVRGLAPQAAAKKTLDRV